MLLKHHFHFTNTPDLSSVYFSSLLFLNKSSIRINLLELGDSKSTKLLSFLPLEIMTNVPNDLHC